MIECDCVITIDADGRWHHAPDCPREAERKKNEDWAMQQLKKLEQLAAPLRKTAAEAIEQNTAAYNRGWNEALDAVAFRLMGWSGDLDTFPVNISEMKKG